MLFGGSDWKDSDPIFLKSGTIIEPLMNGWHAWPHLLPPVQHALNVVGRQLPMLRAFMSNPKFHEAAVANPELAGSSYLDYPAADASDVALFIRQTERDGAALISLAKDLTDLDQRLQEMATGGSLEDFYRSVPERLKGCVEFVYDRNGHPSMRLIEQLIAPSDYNVALQQFRLFSSDEDQRKFFLTAPTIQTTNDVVLQIPFTHRFIDVLARANVGGVVVSEFREAAEDAAVWSTVGPFLTSEPVRPRRIQAPQGQLQVSYFGHACVLIETGTASVLLDPVIAWTDRADGRCIYADLPDAIDLVAISHGHHDHFSPETLLQLRHKTRAVAVPACNQGSALDPSLKTMAQRLGFREVVALETLDTVQAGDVQVTAVPFFGEHADLDIRTKQALMVDALGQRMLFIVDSRAFDAETYRQVVGEQGVDVLFVGMECHGAPLSWLYGPLIGKALARRHDESRRLSASDAALAWAVVDAVRPKKVFVYAMGLEPWIARYAGFHFDEDSFQLKEARTFLAKCAAAALPARLLRGSESLDIRPNMAAAD